MSLKIGLVAFGLSLCGVACAAPAASSGAASAAYPSGRSGSAIYGAAPAEADVDARTEKLGPATPGPSVDTVALQDARPAAAASTATNNQGPFVTPSHRPFGR